MWNFHIQPGMVECLVSYEYEKRRHADQPGNFVIRAQATIGRTLIRIGSRLITPVDYEPEVRQRYA